MDIERRASTSTKEDRLHFYFKEDELLCTALIDEYCGVPAYATDPFFKQPIWAWEPYLDALAIYGLHAKEKLRYTSAALKFKKGQIVNMSYLMEEMDLNPFQDALATSGCVRPFYGPKKIKYAWVIDAETMVCYEQSTGRVAALTRWANCGPDKKVRLRLEIGEEDEEACEAIVVTCIVCEYERRRKKTTYRKGSFLDI